jgi:hypothetical protein
VPAFDPFAAGAAVPPPPARKDPRSTRAELAAAGDAWELFEAIRSADPETMDWDVEFDRLFLALRQRVNSFPDEFINDLFDHLLALGTYFTLRTEFLVQYKLRQADAQARHRGGAFLPPDVAQIDLPRLMELGKYTAEIAHLKAATARRTALARAKLSPREASTKAPQPAFRFTNGRTKEPASNGHANHTANGGPVGTRGQTPRRQNGKSAPPENDHAAPPSYVNRLKGRRNGSPPEP